MGSPVGGHTCLVCHLCPLSWLTDPKRAFIFSRDQDMDSFAVNVLFLPFHNSDIHLFWSGWLRRPEMVVHWLSPTAIAYPDWTDVILQFRSSKIHAHMRAHLEFWNSKQHFLVVPFHSSQSLEISWIASVMCPLCPGPQQGYLYLKLYMLFIVATQGATAGLGSPSNQLWAGRKPLPLSATWTSVDFSK